MYCANCGVRLADSEKKCPLCGLEAYHPDLPRPHGEPAYPAQSRLHLQPAKKTLPLLATIFLFLGGAVPVTVDLSVSPGLSWSGYVLGSIGLFYILFVLPAWFRKPNPVVFAVLDTVAIEVFLLCIDLVNHGGWFLSYAFPVAGILGLIAVTEVALLYYLRRGTLYILGGGLIALGGYCMLSEMFSVITFGGKMFRWCLYPMGVLSALGLFLIVTAICRPLREALAKRLFF